MRKDLMSLINCLPVLRVLVDHSKVWKEVFILMRHVQIQNACQIDTRLKILVDFIWVPSDGLSTWKVGETFVYPFDYLKDEKTHIMHGENIKDSAEQNPYFVCVLFPLEYFFSCGNIYRFELRNKNCTYTWEQPLFSTKSRVLSLCCSSTVSLPLLSH
jgi:hypothetical protein